MRNILQDIVNACLGSEEILDVSTVDPTVLFLSCMFLIYFAYLALRSVARFFLNMRF